MNKYFNLTDLAWLLPFFRAAFIFIIGYYIALFFSRKSEKFSSEYASPQHIMLIKKSIYFAVLLIFSIASLQQLNFELSALLGSAGVATVAIGFAAKTSISNMICGLFLILEKSFVVGDTISVKGHQGEIMSIDFLSIKIRTGENTMVRLPNEEIFSSDVINLTHFKQRRLDISISISYETNLPEAQKLLLKIAAESQFNAQKPEASVILDNFADCAINLKLSMWVNKADYYEAKDALQQAIKATFDLKGIHSPYPQMRVHLIEKVSS
jgi:small conductance mechanosensitive channel